MYGLTDQEKINFILRETKKQGITAYDFGQNTSLSDVGARNILEGKSKKPRTKNLNIMIEYLEKLNTGKDLYKNNDVNDGPAIYKKTNTNDFSIDKEWNEKMKDERWRLKFEAEAYKFGYLKLVNLKKMQK